MDGENVIAEATHQNLSQGPPENAELFLGRQSIVDRDHNLVGFELLFRSSMADAAGVSDDFAATATVISHAFNELGLDLVLGKYRGFIKFDAALIMSDIVDLVPREKIVLDLLPSVEMTMSIVERCRQLKAQGFTIAINDCFSLSANLKALMPHVGFVKLDINQAEMKDVERVTQELKSWPVRLLAKKVDTHEKANQCLALGFSLFQGYYFARPHVITGKRTPHSHATLLRLLDMVLEDGNTRDIEEVLKRDPGLTISLMRLANSSSSSLSVEITSPGTAIMMLGRNRLQRALQLLLYANGDAEKSFLSPLLQLVATRGKFMELIALRERMRDKEFAQRAYMTGIMSLMDALLGQPIVEALASLNVSEDVAAAILEHEGPLGKLLMLAEAVDKGDMTALTTAVREFPELTVAKLSALQVEAMRWANNLGEPVRFS